jgi:predicted RNA-binding Zn ribbon-like protein
VSHPPIQNLELIGGVLCLDYANTVDPRHTSERQEYLENYASLVDWAYHTGEHSANDAAALRMLAKQLPREADAVWARAIALREALYVLLTPRRKSQTQESLTVLNDELRRAMSHVTISRRKRQYDIGWLPDAELDRVIWPVVRSAAEIIGSAQLHDVKECDGDGCGWLFADTSKAGRRRWCSMRSCGNRAKSERHRRRVRELHALAPSA